MRLVCFVLSVATACASDLPTRTWAAFRPGSWKTVVSALTDSSGAVLRSGTTKWRLLRVDATESILEMTYLGEKPTRMETRQEIHVPHDQPLYPGKSGTVTARGADDLDVCGEIVACQRVEARTAHGTVTTWFSDKVPGLVVKQIHKNVVDGAIQTDEVDATDWQAR